MEPRILEDQLFLVGMPDTTKYRTSVAILDSACTRRRSTPTSATAMQNCGVKP